MYLKIGKSQVTKPSGIVMSKDGKYHYWACTVSGVATFAKPDRWIKVLENYKTEENLFKTFVCREAKNYLAAGWSKADIAKLAKEHNGNLPKLNPKLKKDPRIPKKVRKQRLKATKTETVIEVVNGVKEEVVKKTYPWSDDPQNYFKSTAPTPIDWAGEDTCHFPARYLDEMCKGCTIYDKCGCKLKQTEKDWVKDAKKSKASPVIKVMNPFADEVKESV